MAKQPKRRILDEFEITAIAAVDLPAQEGAKATIIKRHVKLPGHPNYDGPAPAQQLTDAQKAAGVAAMQKQLETLQALAAAHPPLTEKKATIMDSTEIRKRKTTWENLVAKVQRDYGMGKLAALSKAADLYPAELAEFQAAGIAQQAAHNEAVAKATE